MISVGSIHASRPVAPCALRPAPCAVWHLLGRPRQLLEQIRDSVTPGTGRVIIAVVLPFKPSVEVGSKWVKPKESLGVRGFGVHEQTRSFALDVFEPMGFKVEAVSRAPYLCQGDVGSSAGALRVVGCRAWAWAGRGAKRAVGGGTRAKQGSRGVLQGRHTGSGRTLWRACAQCLLCVLTTNLASPSHCATPLRPPGA